MTASDNPGTRPPAAAVTLAPAPLADMFLIQSHPRTDSRGSFARLFCARDLEAALGERRIVQINLSRTSRAGALRGLHFQVAPALEAKVVRCIRGRVFDVAVDLRKGSPTFLKWYATELDAKGARALFLPEGFAHGFQALEPESEMLYLHTAHYDPAHERGLRWNDPRLGIDWPLPVTDMSERDREHPLLAPDFEGLTT